MPEPQLQTRARTTRVAATGGRDDHPDDVAVRAADRQRGDAHRPQRQHRSLGSDRLAP